MFRIALAAFIGVIALAPLAARAGDSSSARCTDISVPKTAIAAHNGKWIELTAEQWQFLRGIYAMNPATPAGLPVGDRAAMVEVAGGDGALVFFIDGDRACTPMAVPGALVGMMRDVAASNIYHEAGGL